MPDLVTIDEVKDHLRITTNEEDPDLSLKLKAAEALVLAYVQKRDDGSYATTVAAWTAETAPWPIKHAILVQCAELHRLRGDDEPNLGESNDGSDLTPLVKRLLRPYKDLMLA